MNKISRVDAFLGIVEAIDNGQSKRANQMMKVVENSIRSDKRNKEYSSNIELRRDEKSLFSKSW